MSEDKFIYYWLCCVCFIAALTSTYEKHKLDGLKGISRLKRLLSALSSSMLAGYVSFEFALYFIQNERLSVAIAGIGAYIGTEMLEKLQSIVFNYIEKKGK